MLVTAFGLDECLVQAKGGIDIAFLWVAFSTIVNLPSSH